MKKTASIILPLVAVLCIKCVTACADTSEVSAAVSTSIMTWSELQQVIDDAPDGSVVKLTQSLTATSADTCLFVQGDKTITLDLHGYHLNRGLDRNVYEPYGSVLTCTTPI